jgi:hypothetical protein
MANLPQGVGCGPGDRPARDFGASALSELGRLLYAKMERLDPSDGGTWEDLTYHERRFYELCVEEIVSNRSLVDKAYAEIGLPTTTR